MTENRVMGIALVLVIVIILATPLSASGETLFQSPLATKTATPPGLPWRPTVSSPLVTPGMPVTFGTVPTETPTPTLTATPTPAKTVGRKSAGGK